MNVLYLLNYAGNGGTEKYVKLLMEEAYKKGMKPFFVWNIDGKLSQDVIDHMPSMQLSMKHPFDIIAAYRLGKFTKKNGIHIIHTSFLRENYIGVLSKLFNSKVKVIYTNHVMLTNGFALRVLNRIMTKFNTAVIAVCHLGKEILMKNGVQASKIHVIHNAIDLSAFNTNETSTIREEFQIDADTKIITCLSRFDAFKGNRFLLETISALSKRNMTKPYIFLLANEGPLWNEMQELAKQLKIQEYIQFIGYRKDILNILIGSDLYVNPSEWEALSFAILEALGASLPVISTNTGGTPDIINNDYPCGILVPYNQPEKMADAIQLLLEDDALYESMRIETRKNIENKFSIDMMLSKTFNLYRQKERG